MSQKAASVRQRSVFRDLLRHFDGKQAALAHAIGWPAPKVSRILSGDQGIDWNDVVDACDRVQAELRDDPSVGQDIARSLARNVPGVVVEPLDTDEVGDLRDEMDEARIADADLIRVMRDPASTPEQKRIAAETYLRETREAGAAALRVADAK